MWDIEKAPKVTRYADRVLNPLVGKSLVVYLEKPTSPRTPPGRIGPDPDPAGATGLHRVAEAASATDGPGDDADREAVA